MSYQRVERMSTASFQILCGKCIKEARVLWVQQAGFDNNHLVLVECHGEPRMVIVDEFHMRVRRTEDAPAERLQLTWEALRDIESDYLNNMLEGAKDLLVGLRERIENIELFKKMLASPEQQKRSTRFEALANELEE